MPSSITQRQSSKKLTIKFTGFQENKKLFTGIPDQFFGELMPAIKDVNELKLVFYLLWSAYTQGDYGVAFSLQDLLLDERFLQGLVVSDKDYKPLVIGLLEKLVQDNILIKVGNGSSDENSYFINSPRGRAAANLMLSGTLFQTQIQPKVTLDIIKPTIFRLYEENIGPLTPLIADSLRDAQETYPEEWVKEAIQIAVANNVRRWNYIDRILSRWQEEGRDGTDRRNTQEDHRRYLKGEYGEIGRH
jgi:DNA replication protein